MTRFSVLGHSALAAGLQSATAPVLVADINGSTVALHDGASEAVHIFQRSGSGLRLDESRYEAAGYSSATLGSRSLSLETAHLDRLAATNGVARSETFYSSQSGFAGDRVSLLQVEVAGQQIYIGAGAGQSGLQSFSRAADGSLQRLRWRGDTSDSYAADVVAMVSFEIAGQHLVFTASQGDSGISSYSLDSRGRMSLLGSLGAEQGLGISQPSTLLLAEAGGRQLLLLGAAGTGTISVIEPGADGSLTLLDHISDNRDSRFGGIAVMQAVTHGSWTFVVAGGSDDGLSLFALLPSGRLLLLDSLADRADLGLDNVNGLALALDGNQLHVFASSETEPGVTHLSIDTAAGEVLQGSSGTGQLQGSSGNDILIDGLGRDTLDGGAGADLFVFGHSNERNTIHNFDPVTDRIDLAGWAGLSSVAQLTITATASGAVIRFGNNRLDLLTADGAPLSYEDFILRDILGLYQPPLPPPPSPLVLHGTGADEQLIGAAGADNIQAGGGGDSLFGQGGNDSLAGEAGNDVLFGGTGDDTLTGGDGSDQLAGEDGHDSLEGGGGHDSLEGGHGNDTLEGNSSYDRLRGNLGDDHLSGGTGDDTLYGGDGNDTLFGNTARDWLYGGDGHDYISAGDGVDYVEGGSGNDTLYGRSGWDSLNGGAGNDRLYGSQGDDSLSGGLGDDWLSGGSAWDLLFGNSGNDTLYGNFGSDQLSGGTGLDQLYGGTGDDSLSGHGGNDTLQGNQGVDWLDGGAGDDLLRGGTQRDTFVFNSGYDRDEINDFEVAGDILLLSTSLTGGMRDAGDILDTYGRVSGGVVRFDFGGGDVLTLSNLSSLTGLEGAIDTF